MAKTGFIWLIFAVWAGLGSDVRAAEPDRTLTVAAAVQGDGDEKAKADSGAEAKPELSPEQKMQKRFPQPAKVGHLIGLPVLDGNDSTIGYVQQVTRTPANKIVLIVPYAKWFGWARDGGPLAWGRRPVAVPIEVVVILGRQINAIEMDRKAFEQAPTWAAGQSQPLSPDETIRIGLGRR
jgi:hypothetical protein